MSSRSVRRRRRGVPRATPSAAAAAVLGALGCFALAAAYAVEHGLGIAPCELCLLERWPWRALIALSLIGIFVPGRGGRAALVLAVPVILVSIGLASLHVGVENGLWPSPFPECRATPLAGGSVGEQLLRMPMRAAKPCDDPTFLVPGLPFSMATMDLALSLAVLAVAAAGLTRSGRVRSGHVRSGRAPLGRR